MQSGTFEILKNSVALDLSDLSNFVLENYEGFGMAPLRRITERGPLQHGQSDVGYRLEPRLIQLVLALRSTSWIGFYARRQELLNHFSPVDDSPIILRFTQPDGTVRQIDGYVIDGPDFPKQSAVRSLVQRVALRISCPDPAWYDPTRQSVRIVGVTGGSGFTFPMIVPWTFGGATVNSETTINYAGTWLEYPEIQIVGPIQDARIEHVDSGDVLDFDGNTIADGDSYTIDLRYGYKTIVDSAGGNQIAKLTADSDLATWHMSPGENNLHITGASADTTTAIVLRWYNRYLGV
jgi:hypothetical protein